MRVIAIVAWVLLGWGVAAAEAPRAPDPAAIEAARRAALGSDYQRTLPHYEEAAGSGSARGVPLVRRADDRRAPAVDTRDSRRREQGSFGSLVSILLWGVVIVCAVLLGIWLATELSKGDGAAELAPEAGGATAAEAAAILDRPLGDADELARRGEYAEAIHTLLLRTLQELARGAAVRVERSHTSREILARVPVLADARDALAGLITAVELTHFGDDPATAADYERCRRQFHVFAAAFRARGLGGARPEAAA